MSVDPFDLGMDSNDLPLPMAHPAAPWPSYTVIALSVVGCGSAAVWREFWPAVVTYGVLLIGGCGLLFYRRQLQIAATRRAGGAGFVSISNLDRVALMALVAACLINGIVIAMEVARWEWGA
ncbi:MAG: hypothetical protein LBJ02_01330 [Bifidobacteriaceae bacterium]|nr:hypothetical protein [Bifidobacteriaceae bacterium]